MLTKRIVVALDIKGGRVVKGVKFENIRDAGDPIELAKRYEAEGADELVFLDITASYERRKIMADLVERVAREIYIPFTVGGGIREVDEMREIVKLGADKVFINTVAVERPEIIDEAVDLIGSSNLVVAIDAKWNGSFWEVYTHGGRNRTGLNLLDWAREVERRGAGEILLTSMDTDGTKDGYDIKMTEAVVRVVNIPVIASGGAGKPEHFYDVFRIGASAALAASIFHYGEYRIMDVKDYLRRRNVNVRIV